MNSEIAEVATATAKTVDPATAFEELYEEHRAAVVRFLMAFGGSEDRAVDLASQTFARAWSECRRGRTIGLGWLLRTARNAAVDASRRAAVRRRMPRTESAGFEPSAEDIVIRRDRAATLRAAVVRLPSPQREALVLRFTTSLPVREIGTVIGKGEDATEKLIARAIRRLREDFDEHQP